MIIFWISAVLLRDREAEDAELLQLLHEPVRVDVGVLKLRRGRDDLRINEFADGTQDVTLDLGEPIGIGETSHAPIVRASPIVRAPPGGAHLCLAGNQDRAQFTAYVEPSAM
jgi:hypothetical protein